MELQRRQDQEQMLRREALEKEAEEDRKLRISRAAKDSTASSPYAAGRNVESNNAIFDSETDHAFMPVVKYAQLKASIYRSSRIRSAVIGALWNAEALYDNDERQPVILHCVETGDAMSAPSGESRPLSLEPTTSIWLTVWVRSAKAARSYSERSRASQSLLTFQQSSIHPRLPDCRGQRHELVSL